MATTPVQAVRRWLVDQLSGLSLSDGSGAAVDVFYSDPGPDSRGKAAVWFVTARTTSLAPANHRSGRIRREETVLQPFVIQVRGEGLDQEAADEQALAIYEAIDDWAADADNVQAAAAATTNQQIQHLLLAGWQQGAGPVEDGHVAELLCTFTYRATYL